MSELTRTAAHYPEPDRRTLTTSDGITLDGVVLPGSHTGTRAVIMASGFTGGWRLRINHRIAQRLRSVGDVACFDYRGHHSSSGESTVGDREIHDVQAVLQALRDAGYRSVVTVGFSLGAAVAVRHAALLGGVDAVVAVGGPSHWYYRGTLRMRLLHYGVERAVGRAYLRAACGVRVIRRRWDPVPADPTELVASIAPTPLLIVHGERDAYFPVAHAQRLYRAAREPKELWLEPGMGHGESGTSAAAVDRIAAWLNDRVAPDHGAAERDRGGEGVMG